MDVCVLAGERTARPRVGEYEAPGDADSSGESHYGCKASLADERGRHLLPVKHQSGAKRSHGGSGEPVGRACVCDHTFNMSCIVVSTCFRA